MALLTAKGYRVQPFKCGPDYIDTKFHEAVCGHPSINLDTFMATPARVKELFAQYGEHADICIIEGMMGLFDGYNRDQGSSAEIAATLERFIHFRKDVRIVGVIFNKVGSQRHYQLLREVCNDLHITCFGYLPKDTSLEQASRYLGLDFSEQAEQSQLIKLLEEHVRWQELLQL